MGALDMICTGVDIYNYKMPYHSSHTVVRVGSDIYILRFIYESCLFIY